MDKCLACKFYVELPYSRGQCHRLPKSSVWPEVRTEDWCGEFKLVSSAPNQGVSPISNTAGERLAALKEAYREINVLGSPDTAETEPYGLGYSNGIEAALMVLDRLMNEGQPLSKEDEALIDAAWQRHLAAVPRNDR